MITCTLEKGYQAELRHVVVHAIVEKGGALLLIKRAPTIIEGSKWALPGGFLDRGETVADGAIRELLEETGWKGEIVSLFRINSNPDRPGEDRQNVAFEFLVKPLKQIGKPDKESDEIRWVKFEDIASLGQLAFDHGETIARYRAYQVEHFPLPILV